MGLISEVARLSKRLVRKTVAKASMIANPGRVRDVAPRAGEAYLEAEPWIIEELRVESEAGRLSVKGWAFPPNCEARAVRFLLNGREFEDVAYPRSRPELVERFWQRKNAGQSGFEISTSLLESEVRGDDALEIQFEFDGKAASEQPGAIPELRASVYRAPSGDLRMPEANRRYRVIGTESLEMFLLGGATDFYKLQALVHAQFGRHFEDFDSILDWGCGCGRVARHFKDVPGVKFSGGDIDSNNIAWCAENLPFGSFSHLPLVPPTKFADDSFDLVYGISVFTHLHEEIQHKWLAELKRITKPGGVILVTVHGVTALNYGGLAPTAFGKIFDEVQEMGFVVTSGNEQIDEYIEDSEYYINVMHAKWYIREKWSRYFRVVDIVPGSFYIHDMVVLVNE